MFGEMLSEIHTMKITNGIVKGSDLISDAILIYVFMDVFPDNPSPVSCSIAG